MMSYVLTKMTDIIEFNPRETIARKQVCKKVPMEYLQPFTRQISGFEEAPYAGGTKFRNNDTIMARITPCLENGKTAFVKGFAENEVVFGSTEYIVMRAIPGASDPVFIYYLATSPSFREVAIKSMVGSSGRQRVQQDVLENLELVLPDYETQVRVGKVLSAFDDKIELNAQINHNLEEQAKAIFKSWFVDFEPFRDGNFVDSELG
ncbi:MAG: restriction endonuclease subunit S, partial [Lentisphaeria bacterium]|nr:restriction endonuclease subunit S [Lentisphaeria bacterium]